MSSRPSPKKQIIREHVLSLIKTGHNGLIRYMQKGTAVPKPRQLFQYDVLALLIVDEGFCTYLVNEEKVECPKGTMMWAFPDQQRTLYDRSPDLSLWVVEFTQDLVKEICTEDGDRILQETNPSGTFHHRIPSSEHRFIRAVLQRIVGAGPSVQRKEYFNEGLRFLLLHCWSVFQSIGDVKEDGNSVHPAVARVIHLIRDEGDVESSVVELAARAGLCPSRLMPLFQEQTGMSITEFRNRQKIERFLDLYSRNGQFNMLGAALEAGFGSYAQFFRVFKNLMGQSPSEYFSKICELS